MLNVPCIYWISHIMDYGGYVVQMMEVSSLEDFYYYRTKVSHLSRLESIQRKQLAVSSHKV